jgi:hypothetical protein
MRAGFATTPILPPRTSLAGVADRRMPRWYTSVLDEPRARAMALSTDHCEAVLVSGGFLTCPPALRQAVLTRLEGRLPVDVEVVLHGDHTHSGPGNYWRHRVAHRFMGPFVPETLSWLAGRLADVILAAWEARTEATLRTAQVDLPGLQVNRKRPDGPLDPALTALFLTTPDGRPLGSLVHFTAHPRIAAESRDFHAASGDWPARVSTTLEPEAGPTLVVNGALGSLDPVMPPPPFDAGPALQAFAAPLVEAVRALQARALPDEPVLAFARREVALTRFHAEPFPPGHAWWTPLAAPAVRLWDRLIRHGIPTPQRVPVSALRLGRTALVFHPSDYGVEAGLVTREVGRGLGLRALPCSHADDYAGYVHMPDEMDRPAVRRDPYAFFTVYENLMGFHGRGAYEPFALAERAVLEAVAS